MDEARDKNRIQERQIIVALDFAAAEEALRLAARLDAASCRLKVGKELFTRAGPDIVRRLQQQGFEVFLDLKFHDIPNTVAAACRAAAELGVWMVNVHAAGGTAMLRAARAAIDGGTHKPLLIAVTVLTSMDAQALAEVGIDVTPLAQVGRLAQLARDCGLDGVVCSPQEIALVKGDAGYGFLAVTPGIRPAGAGADDQQRIATPASAIGAGADYLVIGRPITRAADPAAAVAAIRAELAGARRH